MKKQLLTLTGILLCLSTYAQKTFTEGTFTDMMNRLQTDPAFFKNEADPSFTITFGNGNTSSQEAMLKFAENNIGLYKRQHANLKVSQVGSTGIATGTVTESFLSKDNPSIIVRAIYEHLFTYTFSQVKGKWLWVSGQHTEFRNTKEADEAAIKQIIEGQTQATYDRNLDKVLSYWANVSYLSMVMPSLNVNVNGAEKLKKLLTDFIKGNPTPDKSTTVNDYRSIRIQGNAAFVLQDETVTNPDGAVTKYVCNRYLEKQNNEWKLVSSVITTNNKSFSATTMKELFDEYKNDSKAFMNNRLSEDFRFTNPKGNYQPQKDFLGGTAQSIVSAEMLQPVIFQSGDLAVTSGIHHNVLTNKDGNQYTRDVAATYTWQRRNGKWMFVGSQQNNITAPVAEDEAAIKQVLTNETVFVHKQEVSAKDYLNLFAASPDLTFGPYLGAVMKGYDAFKPMVEDVFQKKLYVSTSTDSFSDWNIKINGNSAFVTAILTNTMPNGKQTSHYKLDHLTKINGEWKILNHWWFAKK